MHDGRHHVTRLGKDINRKVAGELARVWRAAVLKGEAVERIAADHFPSPGFEPLPHRPSMPTDDIYALESI